jgi:hypothetical protein
MSGASRDSRAGNGDDAKFIWRDTERTREYFALVPAAHSAMKGKQRRAVAGYFAFDRTGGCIQQTWHSNVLGFDHEIV